MEAPGCFGIPFDDSYHDIGGAAFVASPSVLWGSVSLDKGFSIGFGAVLRGDIRSIRIGERTNVQDGSVLHVSGDFPVFVGADMAIEVRPRTLSFMGVS